MSSTQVSFLGAQAQTRCVQNNSGNIAAAATPGFKTSYCHVSAKIIENQAYVDAEIIQNLGAKGPLEATNEEGDLAIQGGGSLFTMIDDTNSKTGHQYTHTVSLNTDRDGYFRDRLRGGVLAGYSVQNDGSISMEPEAINMQNKFSMDASGTSEITIKAVNFDTNDLVSSSGATTIFTPDHNAISSNNNILIPSTTLIQDTSFIANLVTKVDKINHNENMEMIYGGISQSNTFDKTKTDVIFSGNSSDAISIAINGAKAVDITRGQILGKNAVVDQLDITVASSIALNDAITINGINFIYGNAADNITDNNVTLNSGSADAFISDLASIINNTTISTVRLSGGRTINVEKNIVNSLRGSTDGTFIGINMGGGKLQITRKIGSTNIANSYNFALKGDSITASDTSVGGIVTTFTTNQAGTIHITPTGINNLDILTSITNFVQKLNIDANIDIVNSGANSSIVIAGKDSNAQLLINGTLSNAIGSTINASAIDMNGTKSKKQYRFNSLTSLQDGLNKLNQHSSAGLVVSQSIRGDSIILNCDPDNNNLQIQFKNKNDTEDLLGAFGISNGFVKGDYDPYREGYNITSSAKSPSTYQQFNVFDGEGNKYQFMRAYNKIGNSDYVEEVYILDNNLDFIDFNTAKTKGQSDTNPIMQITRTTLSNSGKDYHLATIVPDYYTVPDLTKDNTQLTDPSNIFTLNDGDNITINAQTFTFKKIPVEPTDFNSIQSLSKAINDVKHHTVTTNVKANIQKDPNTNLYYIRLTPLTSSGITTTASNDNIATILNFQNLNSQIGSIKENLTIEFDPTKKIDPLNISTILSGSISGRVYREENNTSPNIETSSNGYSYGEYIDYTIDNGYVIGHYTNDQRPKLYQIKLAVFPDANALALSENGYYIQTNASGAPKMYTSEKNSIGGSIYSKTLEASNVNEQVQMLNLVSANMVYSENMFTISKINDMNKEILNRLS